MTIMETIIDQNTSAVESNRFLMKIKSGEKEFILDYPHDANYTEAFNATMTFLLQIYDLSKKAPAVPVEGEINNDK